MYTKYRVKMAGIAPLLQHNGRLADPLNPTVKMMKEISGKRKKVDADITELAHLEFLGSLYIDKHGAITFPDRVIEAAIAAGARKTKEGKTALSALFVEPGVVFDFEGPKDPEDRWADPAYRNVTGVRVGQSRVMRTRPQFDKWSLTFDVSVMEDEISRDMLTRWCEAAGRLLGFGDWRPRYGRAELVTID